MTVMLERRTPLKRRSHLRSVPKSTKPRAISPASPEQRDKVRDRACIVCAQGPCDPAHVIPRSLGGCNDPLCVVPLCRPCHRAYDEGFLDLLPYCEPRFRDEMAHAVQHVGLGRAYARITNDGWEKTA